jgi:hypothetical protein
VLSASCHPTSMLEDLESLLVGLLNIKRRAHVDSEGKIMHLDIEALNTLIKDGSEKILTYAKYSRIANNMLRGEMAKKTKKKKDGAEALLPMVSSNLLLRGAGRARFSDREEVQGELAKRCRESLFSRCTKRNRTEPCIPSEDKAAAEAV